MNFLRKLSLATVQKKLAKMANLSSTSSWIWIHAIANTVWQNLHNQNFFLGDIFSKMYFLGYFWNLFPIVNSSHQLCMKSLITVHTCFALRLFWLQKELIYTSKIYYSYICLVFLMFKDGLLGWTLFKIPLIHRKFNMIRINYTIKITNFIKMIAVFIAHKDVYLYIYIC